MREPLFLEFADACLRVLHPETAAKRELTDQEVVQKLQEQAERKEEEEA